MKEFPNQYLSKGEELKCSICGETSAITIPMPLEQFIKQLESFSDLHHAKGCNDKK